MMLLRRYREDDFAQVWALHVMAMQHIGAYLGEGPWEADLHDIPGVYLYDRGEFLVAEENGRIIAMGAIRRTDDERAELKRMRVHPDMQGRGLGKMLLAELERRARELGYRVLHLDTTTVQYAAMALYLHAGFVETHRAPLRQWTNVFMEKRL